MLKGEKVVLFDKLSCVFCLFLYMYCDFYVTMSYFTRYHGGKGS